MSCARTLVLIAISMLFGLPSQGGAADPDAAKLAGYAGPKACKFRGAVASDANYEFTADWFSGNIPLWTRLLAPLKDRPTRYLEVGVYEGRSLLFVLDNILQHPKSEAVAVDIVIAERYLRNLARSGACGKVRNYQARSGALLRHLPPRSFDVIYIDGSHTAADVLVDAVLAFDLLKNGGLLIFDDYKWHPEWPAELRPVVAVDAFIAAYRHRLIVEHLDYQVVVRKRAHPCGDDVHAVSPVGEYCYDWESGSLTRQGGQAVQISRDEKRVIEAIARAPRSEPDGKLRADPAFRDLNTRLRLVP